MKKIKSILFLFVAMLVVPLMASPVLAQEQQEVSCFDYYEFQSIKVSIGADKSEFVPGDTVKFSGSIINSNLYPIVDGYLFARVVKENPSHKVNGHLIVDEFFAAEKFIVDADSSKKVSFNWRVPAGLSKGSYKVMFSFTAGKRFNLAGLAFTNEVVASTADFKVNSVNESSVFFDRAATKVNDVAYFHIADDSSYEPGKPIVITQPIKNTYKENKNVKIRYELYYWDGLDDQDKIKSTTEEVQIPASSFRTLTYTIDKVEAPIYYLRITATSGDDESIVNVRLVSPLERPRINFPTVTNFPLKAGEKAGLFVCFHNGSDVSGKGNVVVSLSDKDGNELSKINYSGDISSKMKAFVKEFTAAKDYTYLKLKAEVYDSKNALVEKYETAYDCQTLGSPKCQEMLTPPAVVNEEEGVSAIIIATASILAVLLVAIVILVIRRKKASVEGVALVALAVAGLGAMSYVIVNDNVARPAMAARQVVEECRRNPEACSYFGKNVVEDCTAQSQCSASVGRRYAHFWLYAGGIMGKSIADGFVNVEHKTNVTKPVDGDRVGDVSNLKAGDRLAFNYDPENPFYHGFAGRFDTPYGEWRSSLDQLRNGVAWGGGTADKNFMRNSAAGNNAERVATLRVRDMEDGSTDTAWLFWTAVKPSPALSSSDSSIVSCSGLVCTAASKSGSATISMDIPETTVKIWSLVYTDIITKGGWIASIPGYNDPNIKSGNTPYLRPNTNVDKERAEARKDGNDRLSGEQSPFADKSTFNLPAAQMQWVVNVTEDESDDSDNDNPPPCTTNCGGGGSGSACSSTSGCQAGLCCLSSMCSADCGGSGGDDDDGVSVGSEGAACVSTGDCRTGLCCQGSGSSRACSSECIPGDFSLILSRSSVEIFLTDNPGEHSSPGVRVSVDPSSGFDQPVNLSIASSNPADLMEKMTNRSTAFSDGTLTSVEYSDGAFLTVKVPGDILPDQRSTRTYRMVIMGKAGGIEKFKTLEVTVHGSKWNEG